MFLKIFQVQQNCYWRRMYLACCKNRNWWSRYWHFYPPDDINKLDGKDVQEEKARKSSWIRAIQIYKLCVKSGYFDSSDTSDKSQNPFDDDDNDDRSLDSRNDTPIWMGGKNLKLIKSKNNSTKKGE